MNVEEDHIDVLQNIEASIVAVHKAHRKLTDADALACIEAYLNYIKEFVK
jgi:DNA-binding FrmR family transcriptional regulator